MIANRNNNSSSQQEQRQRVPAWGSFPTVAFPTVALGLIVAFGAQPAARCQENPFVEDVFGEETSEANFVPLPSALQAKTDRLEPQVTELDRGPVHEAFATNSVPTFYGDTAPLAPPTLIDESPSVAMPNGRNMIWVDGYWYWSEPLEQYIWISGMYRHAPPGRTWIPGLWSKQADGRHVRYGGYWQDPDSASDPVLPTPPAIHQPISPGTAPTNDAFWVPGNWNYQNSGYQWTRGYWGQHQAGLVWQPSSYMKTAHGFVFVSGYWDYDPAFRGVPNAPIVVAPTIFASPNFMHRPSPWAADPSTLVLNTFGQAGRRQYFYGDYYSPNAENAGILPWYHPGMQQPGANPLAGYFDWRYQAIGIPFLANLNQFYDTTMQNPPGHSSTRVGFGVSRSRSRFQSVSVSPFGTTLDAVARNPRNGLAPVRVSVGGYGDRPLSTSWEHNPFVQQPSLPPIPSQ